VSNIDPETTATLPVEELEPLEQELTGGGSPIYTMLVGELGDPRTSTDAP